MPVGNTGTASYSSYSTQNIITGLPSRPTVTTYRGRVEVRSKEELARLLRIASLLPAEPQETDFPRWVTFYGPWMPVRPGQSSRPDPSGVIEFWRVSSVEKLAGAIFIDDLKDL